MKDQNTIVAEFAATLPPIIETMPRELVISELKRHGLTDESPLILYLNTLEQDSLTGEELKSLIEPAPMALTDSDRLSLCGALSAMLPEQKAPVGLFRTALRGLEISQGHPFMQAMYEAPDNAEFTREAVHALALKHGLDLDPLEIPPYANDTKAAAPAEDAPPAKPGSAPQPRRGEGRRGEAGSPDHSAPFHVPSGARGFGGPAERPPVEQKPDRGTPAGGMGMGMGRGMPPVMNVSPFAGLSGVTGDLADMARSAGRHTRKMFGVGDAFKQARDGFKQPDAMQINNQRATALSQDIGELSKQLGGENGASAAAQLAERVGEAQNMINGEEVSAEAKGSLVDSLKDAKGAVDELSPEQKANMGEQLQNLIKALTDALRRILKLGSENDGPSM